MCPPPPPSRPPPAPLSKNTRLLNTPDHPKIRRHPTPLHAPHRLPRALRLRAPTHVSRHRPHRILTRRTPRHFPRARHALHTPEVAPYSYPEGAPDSFPEGAPYSYHE
eukprot:46291-Prorocentrum_minimum.AAC.1